MNEVDEGCYPHAKTGFCSKGVWGSHILRSMGVVIHVYTRKEFSVKCSLCWFFLKRNQIAVTQTLETKLKGSYKSEQTRKP